jgi:hypothetical protein
MAVEEGDLLLLVLLPALISRPPVRESHVQLYMI